MDAELRQDAIRRRRSSHYYEEVDIIFQDPTIRLHFIRKVYMILALMLLCTFGFTTLCIFEKYTKLWILEHPYVVVIALGINIITTIALMCCQCARRVFPLNLLLLVLVTMSMSYVAAFVSCFYDTQIVMSAFGGTALICIVLTFIACQNWFDITTWGIYFCIAGLIVIVYGVVAGVVYAFTGNPILNLIYSCLVCLLTSMILIYDTQQVVGGKRIQLSPEEYILGALQLYVDIITIYIFILDIFSGYQ
ncbi:unnamed protein product [Acanthoscelides obtectus]|nr:unnamed protein product [Acanthoscelides obtectus]CAK1661287.1 Protein lifeguard 2 [Acanthoscelides obtectus]